MSGKVIKHMTWEEKQAEVESDFMRACLSFLGIHEDISDDALLYAGEIIVDGNSILEMRKARQALLKFYDAKGGS